MNVQSVRRASAATYRQRIATFPESIADPKNVQPTTLGEAQQLLAQTQEAHQVVSSYAERLAPVLRLVVVIVNFIFRVKIEKIQTKELQKELARLDSFLLIEAKLDRDLLKKANICMDMLRSKQADVCEQFGSCRVKWILAFAARKTTRIAHSDRSARRRRSQERKRRRHTGAAVLANVA